MTDTDVRRFTLVPTNAIQRVLGNVNYTPAFALAELIDNAYSNPFASRVDVVIRVFVSNTNPSLNAIEVSDNASGITEAGLQYALSVGNPNPNPNSLSEHGVGMKSSCAWIGELDYILTKTEDSPTALKAYGVDYEYKPTPDSIAQPSGFIEDAYRDGRGTTIRIRATNERLIKCNAKDPLKSTYHSIVPSVAMKLGQIYQSALSVDEDSPDTSLTVTFEFYDVDAGNQLYQSYGVVPLSPPWFERRHFRAEPVIDEYIDLPEVGVSARLRASYKPVTREQVSKLKLDPNLVNHASYPFRPGADKSLVHVYRHGRLVTDKERFNIAELGTKRTRDIYVHLDLYSGIGTVTSKNALQQGTQAYRELGHAIDDLLRGAGLLSRRNTCVTLTREQLLDRLSVHIAHNERFRKSHGIAEGASILNKVPLDSVGTTLDIVTGNVAWELSVKVRAGHTGPLSYYFLKLLSAEAKAHGITRGIYIAESFTDTNYEAVRILNDMRCGVEIELLPYDELPTRLTKI